jgi:hypothetical protein
MLTLLSRIQTVRKPTIERDQVPGGRHLVLQEQLAPVAAELLRVPVTAQAPTVVVDRVTPAAQVRLGAVEIMARMFPVLSIGTQVHLLPKSCKITTSRAVALVLCRIILLR